MTPSTRVLSAVTTACLVLAACASDPASPGGDSVVSTNAAPATTGLPGATSTAPALPAADGSALPGEEIPGVEALIDKPAVRDLSMIGGGPVVGKGAVRNTGTNMIGPVRR